jgi:tellurite resistance protein TehA-like permease
LVGASAWHHAGNAAASRKAPVIPRCMIGAPTVQTLMSLIMTPRNADLWTTIGYL